MITSRERVRRLLERQPVDRVPNGLGGCETTGLHVLASEKLRAVLGLPPAAPRMSTFMSTAVLEPDLLDAIEGDVVFLGSKLCPARLWGPGAASDWREERLWGRRMLLPRQWRFRTDPDGSMWIGGSVCAPGSIFFDAPPRAAADMLPSGSLDPDAYNPTGDIPDETLRGLEEQARFLFESTDRAICCGELLEDLQEKPHGMLAWWMSLAQEPQAVDQILGKACDASICQIGLLDQAIGRYADILQIADDMGDRRGVTIGPELWRAAYKPHYKRLFGEWHRRTRMKVSLHSCGSIVDILEDLIECGLDVYNPVQVSARGMEPEGLKARFGGRLVFWGGAFDAVATPPETPAEVVYETVRRNIEVLSAGGGYLFAGVHNITGDIPESHLAAILRAYRDVRGGG
jgi:uroporphyrinogen decarboxylase